MVRCCPRGRPFQFREHTWLGLQVLLSRGTRSSAHLTFSPTLSSSYLFAKASSCDRDLPKWEVTWCPRPKPTGKMAFFFLQDRTRAGGEQKVQSYLQQKAWSLPLYIGWGWSPRFLGFTANCSYFSTSFLSNVLGCSQGGNQMLHVCYSNAVSVPIPWPYNSPVPLEILSPCGARHLLYGFCKWH